MKSVKDSLFTRIRPRNILKSKTHLSLYYDYSLEAKLYNEKNVKAILDQERKVQITSLTDIKTENQQMNRIISRNKMFNKKDEDRKAKKELRDKLSSVIRDNNNSIEENDVALDREKRRLDDRSLLKKQLEKVMQLK